MSFYHTIFISVVLTFIKNINTESHENGWKKEKKIYIYIDQYSCTNGQQVALLSEYDVH